MYQDLNDIKKEFSEVLTILNPKVIQKVMSHLTSLGERVRQLEESRNLWKKKYYELKNEA